MKIKKCLEIKNNQLKCGNFNFTSNVCGCQWPMATQPSISAKESLEISNFNDTYELLE